MADAENLFGELCSISGHLNSIYSTSTTFIQLFQYKDTAFSAFPNPENKTSGFLNIQKKGSALSGTLRTKAEEEIKIPGEQRKGKIPTSL